MVMTDAETFSVDTPEDLERVVKLMEQDALIYQYKGAF